MALQGPFVVVADNPAPDVVEALQTAGAFPIIETNWADPAAALAESSRRHRTGRALQRPARSGRPALDESLMAKSGAFTPVIARTREDGVRACRRRDDGRRPRPNSIARLGGLAAPHLAQHRARPYGDARPAATACPGCRIPIRSKKRPCWSPAAAALSGASVAVGERVGSSARSASKPPRAVSTRATSTEW